MISRIWHGYTTPENADTYEELLKSALPLRRALATLRGPRAVEDRLDVSDVNFFWNE
jgi:hypothetical protein